MTRATSIVLAAACAWPLAAAAQPPPDPAHGTHQPAPHRPADQPPVEPVPASGHAPHEHADAPDLPPHVPPLTEADRAAAFPDAGGHAVHDTAIHAFVLVDQLEWQGARRTRGLNWEAKGWIGGDLARFWFRSEGEGTAERVETAQVHALYGRAISPWWDVVAGIRQDVRPGSPQTWAAVGIQGLAPYWFEVEATAYVGAAGRTHLRVEAEYELLLTNRLVFKPLVEVEMASKADPARRIGAGLGTMEAGLRLRYEIRREFAPYIGVVWHGKFFGTAERAREAGERTGGTRLAVGLRVWW